MQILVADIIITEFQSLDFLLCLFTESRNRHA